MAWLDFFTGSDTEETQATIDATDAALARENARDRNRYGDAWFAQVEQNRRAAYISDVNSEVHLAFGEGFEEGASNIRGAIGGTVNAVVTTPFRVIPWQLWIAGLLFAAWKLGLLDGLLRRR